MEGRQAGEGGSCWSDQGWSQGWTEATGKEGKRLQGWQAQLHVEGSTCAMGHRGVTSFPPVKWDSLVSEELQHIRAQLAPSRQLSSALQTQFPWKCSYSLVASALILSGTTPSSFPVPLGIVAGSPPHTPQATETPITCPQESKTAHATRWDGPRAGRNEQPTDRAHDKETPITLTEVFWHWMLVLLKRRAVTRVVLPGMWKMHS